MPYMKSLTLTVQKLKQMLKLTKDRQTDRTKTICPDHSIRGHTKRISRLGCSLKAGYLR